MPGALQSKGDGEYPFSAPFTGLNIAAPSIVLPATAQDAATSPSFAIVRGSIAAPWPYAPTLFGTSLETGEYLLFATPSGYVVTNFAIYQIQEGSTPTQWQLTLLVSMPAGAFPLSSAVAGGYKPTAWVEANGCLYFSSNFGIYRYSPANGLMIWAANFGANWMTISNQRLVIVGAVATTDNNVPGTPVGTPGTSGGMATGTYYAVVTPVFASGTEGPPSAESAGVSVTGPTGSIAWTWTAVPGAVSYNIYVGTAPGAESEVFTSGTNSYAQAGYTAGTVAPPVFAPIGIWTIAWSAVTDFSATSVGSFNSNPNTSAGVVGGFDVLTSYSAGIPSGIVNLGHSFYVMMTQGIVEVDPAQNPNTGAFTLYSWWQANVPVGPAVGSVAQYSQIAAFVTPDNVYIWGPGGQQPIGTPIMPLLRGLLRNAAANVSTGGNPYTIVAPFNATFYTIYNELHYCLAFSIRGVPPVQGTPPYPNQPASGVPVWFGLLLDYNMVSQAWTWQLTPPLGTPLYQVILPPVLAESSPGLPPQNLLISSTIPGGGANEGNYFVIATDVIDAIVWTPFLSQAAASVPQPCKVGFPQTPITPGHRPANRRVRIEYSMDELSCATQTAPVNLTVTVQGTITQNTGPINGNGVATTIIESVSSTIQIQPPGIESTAGSAPIQPFLTATAYADMVLSCENPQVSLSWTDPSAHQRLLIHRVTLMVNDTKGTMQ